MADNNPDAVNPPSLKELALEVAMFLDQIADRDFNDNTFITAEHLAFALRANVDTQSKHPHVAQQLNERAVPALDCLVRGHIWKTEGNKTICEYCGTGVEFHD